MLHDNSHLASGPFHLANGRQQFRTLVCLVLCCLPAGMASAGEPQAAPVASSDTGAPIERWVIQLDDDRFDIRQRAQHQLEQSGQSALEAVAASAQTGSLESTTRALNILLAWSESKNEALRRATLEKLVNLPHRPRAAAMATRMLAEVREKTAVSAILKLGGRIIGDPNTNNYGKQIVIGADWKGGNEGLRHLVDIQLATTISLYVAPITDPGMEHLPQLANVRRVELYGTPISKEAINKLRTLLPNTIVDVRGGAMLGIRGNVTNVVKNSAADKAGIRPRDRITEFNGEKIADFEGLIKRIAKQQPGDTVTLTIERNRKTQQVEVTFDQWNASAKTDVIRRQRVPAQIPQGFPPKIVLPAKPR